jgi:hypothetical protein
MYLYTKECLDTSIFRKTCSILVWTEVVPVTIYMNDYGVAFFRRAVCQACSVPPLGVHTSCSHHLGSNHHGSNLSNMLWEGAHRAASRGGAATADRAGAVLPEEKEGPSNFCRSREIWLVARSSEKRGREEVDVRFVVGGSSSSSRSWEDSVSRLWEAKSPE